MSFFSCFYRPKTVKLLSSRWRTCVGAAKGSLANAVGSMYVQKYFKEDAKQSALAMVADIRNEFHAILDEVRQDISQRKLLMYYFVILSL